MDDTAELSCPDNDMMNPALTMTTQVSAILVLSHVFQIFLKPLGQPAPLAQMLAGFVLGPSGLSRSPSIHVFFFQNFAVDFYESMALYCRISIMFLIGLEMDIPYLMRNLRPASIIACAGCLMCTIFASTISFFVYEETGSRGSRFTLALVITVILANTASPIVFRLATDLKFATSDIGRLAISSSLIGDMYAVFILVIISGEKNKRTFSGWALMAFFSLLLLVGIIIFTSYLVNWLNHRNRNKKNLQAVEVMLLCSVILVAAMTLETMGFSSIIACFLMGSMFPRGGKSARTLLAILTYTVHNFIFPIYFGYTGFKADTSYLNELKRIGIVLMVIVLSIGGKIFGTVAACYYLKTPLNEGVLLAFLMNMKGHVDILTLTTAMQNKVINSSVFYNLMVSAVVLSSLISAALIGFLVRREKDTIGIKHIPMEYHSPDKELKLVACVHSSHPVNSMVRLIVSLRGSDNVPISPYLVHLVELPEQTKKSNSSIYEQEEGDTSDDDNDVSNDAVQINETVDMFIEETKMMIQQGKIVSPFSTMDQDVCDFAGDKRTSFIVLPFHKHQRIDGKFETGKESIRTTNQKVLRNSQCSVAILVDRGHTTTGTQAAGSESLQQIATLFFGGPDDREALGFSKRLSTHHHSSVTVFRFLPTSAKGPNGGVDVAQKEEDVLVTIQDQETEVEEADRSALANFYHRYVTSGKVRFVEKYVDDGVQTGSILRDMAETYSMFVVGKGGRSDSLLTTGISDWEECPELGVVGDFLASSEFDDSGSVLVVQQHR
ncbi:cation/H(+) antiporter 2-like [Bidens hawaiensis]|uniref:cation/H(+) antiporter 2-like n=1 Tax=Bidens hawaiensis TaxID=980011 RepID=UPI004049C42C